LAGLGRIAPRRSRDICADERTKAKRAHHACPKCRARIDFGFGSIFGSYF